MLSLLAVTITRSDFTDTISKDGGEIKKGLYMDIDYLAFSGLLFCITAYIQDM
jgi:hypothetical protein